MDHRHRYLAAMGIQVWGLRRPLGEAAAPLVPPTDPMSPDQDGSFPQEGLTEVVPAKPLSYEDKTGESQRSLDSLPPCGGGLGRGPGGQAEGAPPRSPPPPNPHPPREGDQKGGGVLSRGRDKDRTAHIARLDWSELQAEVNRCTACGLHATRTQAVFGVGDRQAQWLIIGEAPGADEDRLGEPFVGKAGKLLDAMLLALGLKREQVFIANILKSRPPNNRDPLPEEIRACWPFIERQIDLIRPKIILAIGRIAAQTLLQTEVPVGRLRGRVYRLKATDIPVVVTYHPAYLLRSPREKRKSWEDLQLARRALAGEQGIPSGVSAP